MKKLLLCFLLLAAGAANAQIVNIPNANFKALLISNNQEYYYAKDALGNNIDIDANSDGEIQVSEAENVVELDLNYYSAQFLH